MDELTAEFVRLKKNHWSSVIARCARVVLGSSVIRVFAAGTKPRVASVLESAPIDGLRHIHDESAFREFFERELARIARVVKRQNSGNSRIFPGYKWGHSAKVLCLFLRDVVLQTRYFRDSTVEKLEPLLYAPIDGVIIRRLRSLGIDLPFRQIKGIDSHRKFYKVQSALGTAGRRVGVPRISFDDNWGGNASS